MPRIFVVALAILCGWAVAVPAAEDLKIRIDGKLLRKASGKLVFSLAQFELEGRKELLLENRKTREVRTVRLDTVYEDLSYSSPIPPEEYAAIDPDEWVPYVVWSVPDNNPELNRRLRDIHERQNTLRREIGNALMESGDGGGKVTSRTTLNKIEKLHRVGNILAREILKTWNREDANPFLFPVRIQVGFNPFGASSRGLQTPVQQVWEVMYWEVNRVLMQQYDLGESMVPLLYASPPTVRAISPVGELGRVELEGFFPTVLLASESLDAAIYLQRQQFEEEFKRLIRLKLFRDPFITDRPVLDGFVNEGKVVAVNGKRLAVSFIPPFMRPGEKVNVVLSDDTEAPVVLANVREVDGYTLTDELPDEVLGKVLVGTKVRRPPLTLPKLP